MSWDITANYWRANQFPGYLAPKVLEFQYIKHKVLMLNSNTDPAKSQSSWRVTSPGCSNASGVRPVSGLSSRANSGIAILPCRTAVLTPAAVPGPRAGDNSFGV